MDQNQADNNQIISKLPQKVQDFIDAGNWEKITREISQKYGLQEEQTEMLVDDTLLLITGMANPDQFILYIKEDLLASDIIAEQILDELDRRVFGPNLEMITQEKKIDTISRSPIAKVIIPNKPGEENLTASKNKGFLSEMPPNLPVADEDKEFVGQKVDIPRYIPTKIENIKEEENKKYEDLKKVTASQMYASNATVATEDSGFNSPIGSKITYKPMGQPAPKPAEPIQKPNSVPRMNFNADSPVENEIAKDSFASPTLNSVAPNPAEQPVKKVDSKIENPIVKSYTVDPYREPVE